MRNATEGRAMAAANLDYEVVEGWEQLPEGWSFTEVAGVDIDEENNVYVFTRGEHPLIVFDASGRFVDAWGEGLFTGPHGVTVGPDGRVFLTDYLDHTVRVFTRFGDLLMTLGNPEHPAETGFVLRERPLERAAGPFNMPTNVAIGNDGSILVSDGYGNARVHRFSADGTLLSSWGEPGEGPGCFNLPHGIAVDPDGRVLVADRENCRIQRFTLDGEYLDEWTDFNRVADVHVDRNGMVYVAELGFAHYKPPPVHFRFRREPRPGHDPVSRVSVCRPNGEVVRRLGAGDPEAPGSFVSPHGLCVDGRGDLYVGEVVVTSGAVAALAPFEPASFRKLRYCG